MLNDMTMLMEFFGMRNVEKKETDDVITVYIPLDRISCVTATEKFEEEEEKND